jgi:hypothetical protein
MTDTLRGPLLTAQREVAALDIRRRAILAKVSATETAEKTAYTNATNWQETLQNTAKKAGYVGQHTKLKTELGMVEVQIKDFKQVFGLELFQILVDLEDIQGWLPTVRDIRSIYDQCRRDVEKIHARRKEKELELAKLGGVPMVTTSEASKHNENNGADDDDPNKPSYFKQVAAAEAGPALSTFGTATTTTTADVTLFTGTTTIPPVVAPAAAAASVPMVVPTYKSNGGPLSYTVPAAIPVPSTTSPDLFGSTTTTTLDSSSRSNRSINQYPLQPPLQLSTNTAAAATTAFVDPFGGSGHDSFGSLSTPMGMGGSLAASGTTYDPFASVPPPASNSVATPSYDNDPFAGLDGSGQGSQAQRPMQDNPLFRY